MDKIFNNDFDINIISIAEAVRENFWSRRYTSTQKNRYVLSYFHVGSYEYLYGNNSGIFHAPYIRISHSNQPGYTVRGHILPTKVISFYFTTSVPLPLHNDIKKSIIVPDNKDETDYNCKKALRLYTENPQLNVLEYKGISLLLISQYLKKIHNFNTNEYPEFITDSLKYIDMHKDRMINLNVKDIAQKFNISYEYYVRQFKKHIGITPKQYIIKIKMEYIKMLICKSDMSMAEIAYITGFSDPTYFYNSFKSYYGISPNKYREAHRKF